MATKFEQLFTELTPEECLFYSDWHGIAAVPDKFPKLPYQSVILSSVAFSGDEKVFGDLRSGSRLRLHAVADAVQRRLQRICKDDERAITHVEGYNVPDDPHVVVFQSPVRKSGEKLYNGSVIDWPMERTLAALTIKGAEADMLNLELDRIDKAFPLHNSFQL